jgi:hypothetical protein
MSKKKRKAKRRRKWQQRLRRARSPLDEVNLALGEFLTESGRVEFLMIIYADYVNEAGIERIFADLSGTFGHKIGAFKKWCDFGGSDKDKPRLAKLYKKLDELLPTRNFLVHGETREGVLEGKPKQPYRIGINLADLDHLDAFGRGEHATNVFDLGQIRAATKLCREIGAELSTLRYGHA